MKLTKNELLKSNENLIKENELLKKRIDELIQINELYKLQMKELREKIK